MGNCLCLDWCRKWPQNILKGEMEAYKAAGLEKWLEGKGKVSREELQQWMMEERAAG